MHGAGAALRQAATEMRIVEAEIVAQHVEERRIWVGGNGMRASVDAERKFLTHSGESSYVRRSRSRRLFCSCRLCAKPDDWEQDLRATNCCHACRAIIQCAVSISAARVLRQPLHGSKQIANLGLLNIPRNENNAAVAVLVRP